MRDSNQHQRALVSACSVAPGTGNSSTPASALRMLHCTDLNFSWALG